MSYSLTDYSATEVELNDGLRSYYYKKCYCSVELQGEYIVFTSHKVENNAYRQSWTIAYTDFTTPTGSAAAVLAAIEVIIHNYSAATIVAAQFGQYFSYVTQTAVTNNVGKAMAFETLDLSNGITVVTDGTALSKITFANTGTYNLQFSTQFQNTDNAQHDIYIWLRKNGTTSAADVIGSTGLVSIPARRSAGAGNEGHVIVGWNFLLDVVAGDFYQIIWATNTVANVTIHYYASTANYPSTASTLVTATEIK
jgi:hypothetical protein